MGVEVEVEMGMVGQWARRGSDGGQVPGWCTRDYPHWVLRMVQCFQHVPGRGCFLSVVRRGDYNDLKQKKPKRHAGMRQRREGGGWRVGGAAWKVGHSVLPAVLLRLQALAWALLRVAEERAWGP